jgi:hypothetical protein
MNEMPRIVTVDASNVEKEGFFCFKSKPKTIGYKRKLAWLKTRFDEGLVIKILYHGKRSFGFIEYIPGENGWRTVHAPDHMLIHCIWVVGSGKKRGFATLLLDECINDARKLGKKGVAMVTSSRTWLADSKFFLKRGFKRIDSAPPSFELLSYDFETVEPPRFPSDWDDRIRRFGEGFSIIRTDQCPYVDDATAIFQNAAADRGIDCTIISLDTREQLMDRSPSAFGVFAVTYKGELFTYHYLTEREIAKRFEELES